MDLFPVAFLLLIFNFISMCDYNISLRIDVFQNINFILYKDFITYKFFTLYKVNFIKDSYTLKNTL